MNVQSLLHHKPSPTFAHARRLRVNPAPFLRTRKNGAGFTLIESLVAISILTIAAAAPLVLATQGLSASMLARDQVIAFHLGQEAVEYIRFVRDTNVLSGNDWLTGLSECRSGDGADTEGDGDDEDVCRIETWRTDPYHSATINICNNETCPPLEYIENPNPHYGYEGGSKVQFTRAITIRDVSSEEVSIVVTMSWKSGPFPERSLVIKENMLNWQLDE